MLSNFGLKATDYLPLTGKSDDEPKHRKKQQLYRDNGCHFSGFKIDRLRRSRRFRRYRWIFLTQSQSSKTSKSSSFLIKFACMASPEQDIHKENKSVLKSRLFKAGAVGAVIGAGIGIGTIVWLGVAGMTGGAGWTWAFGNPKSKG